MGETRVISIPHTTMLPDSLDIQIWPFAEHRNQTLDMIEQEDSHDHTFVLACLIYV